MNDKYEIKYLPTTQIEPNRNQPRKTFNDDSITELASSIEKHGLIEPIIVQKANGYYSIVAGERRWRAAMKLHLREVPAIIRELNEQETSEIALIENEQRVDLNPIEKANAYLRYCNQYNVTQSEIADILSKSRASVTHMIRLLQLPQEVQDMIAQGSLSIGHGKAILSASPERQLEIAKLILKENLTVRETEKLAKKQQKKRKQIKNSTEYTTIELELTNTLGTKVQIEQTKNKGIIKIEFYNEEQLEEIYDHFLTKRSFL